MKNINRIVTKKHLKLIVFTNYFLIASIVVILYELLKKKEYTYSYSLVGIVFLLKALSQYIYYKNNKIKKDLFIGVIFVFVGISLIVYKFF